MTASAVRPRTVFFGSPAFAVPSLQRIAAVTELVAVVTQPDRPAGRGQALSEPAVKQATHALAPGLPILQPEKIRTGEFEAALRRLEADLFVVVAYGRILPQSILDLPGRGSWNVHASLLPRLRGAAPIQWAIMNGDPGSGVSIMRMEAGLDTGPVAAVATCDIRDDDTAQTLGERLSLLGASLLADTLPAIAAGTVDLQPQDDGQATLAPLLKKEDGRLDFSQSARLVSARARGVDPWPGATALLDDQVVKLFVPRVTQPAPAAESVPDGRGEDRGEDRGGGGGVSPGTIIRIDAGGLCVACGDGDVTFAEVQLPGRKRVAAGAAAAGRAIAVGARLG